MADNVILIPPLTQKLPAYHELLYTSHDTSTENMLLKLGVFIV